MGGEKSVEARRDWKRDFELAESILRMSEHFGRERRETERPFRIVLKIFLSVPMGEDIFSCFC